MSKAGEGLGGTVAANLAAQHPGDYNHMVSLGNHLVIAW